MEYCTEHFEFEMEQQSGDEARAILGELLLDILGASADVYDDLSMQHQKQIDQKPWDFKFKLMALDELLSPLSEVRRAFVYEQIYRLVASVSEVGTLTSKLSSGDIVRAQTIIENRRINHMAMMRARRTTPEREDAIAGAIADIDPMHPKRAHAIVAAVVAKGHSISVDAIRDRLKKGES